MSSIILLIPHFNNIEGLHRSLKSIDESEAIDVLIVDDGSKQSIDIHKLKQNHTHINDIFLIHLKENRGIETALNTGLNWIKSKNYEYIARLDAGDTCQSNRFKIQKQYLHEHPNVYLIGTWVNFVDMDDNTLFTLKVPTTHQEIKHKMFFNNMFIHPSVMFRSCVINNIGLYPHDYPALEDHAYFFDIVKQYQTANIPKALINYEMNPESISNMKRKIQVKSRIKLIKKHFYFGFYPIVGLIRSYILFFFPRDILTKLKQIIYK